MTTRSDTIDEESYIDEVGGYHSPGDCYNPKGLYCGECSKESCADCEFKEATDWNEFDTYDKCRHADPDERELMNILEFKKRLKERIRRERE